MKLFLYCFREFDEKQYYDELCAQYNVYYEYTTAYPTKENAHLAKGFEGISMTPTPMGAEMLELFYSMGARFVMTRSIGYEHIDLVKAKELGMGVSHVTYDPDVVADYAIMLLMMNLRKMPFIVEQAKVQNYSLMGKIGKNIGDCTIGVIGTGKIGQTVIRHLYGFGCRILANDIYPNDSIKDLCEYVPLDQLYKESDAITLHAPATEMSVHMINKAAFLQMKPGVILVNTARGTLIQTDDLIDALEDGVVGGAALDVLEDERGLYYFNRTGECINNRQMAVLRSFPNVLLTPHTAFYTEKVVRSMAENTIKCLLDMSAGNKNSLILT